MIEETIRLKIEPEGTDEINDALAALDKLEQQAQSLAIPKPLGTFNADLAATRKMMTTATKFAKLTAAAPLQPTHPKGLRPDLAPKPIPDPLTHGAGGKRLAGMGPGILPIIAAFMSPAVIGSFLNKYDPLLKGAANKYFLEAKKHQRLNEYMLGTTPGFLYGTTRAGIDKLRYPEGLPPEPPDIIGTDTKAWRELKGWGANPIHGYPRIYYDSKVFKRQRDQQLNDPWAKHLFWAQKRYKRWRAEPYGAGRPEEPRGTPEHPRELRMPHEEYPLLQHARAFTPAAPERRMASMIKAMKGAAPPGLSPFTELAKNVQLQAPPLLPTALPRPGPFARDAIATEYATGPVAAIQRQAVTAHAAARPPVIQPIEQPLANVPRPPGQPSPPQARRQGISPRTGNTYYIQIDKIAERIEAGTVDERSLMKLLGRVVKTELPT
jgi:hypothetical protein